MCSLVNCKELFENVCYKLSWLMLIWHIRCCQVWDVEFVLHYSCCKVCGATSMLERKHESQCACCYTCVAFCNMSIDNCMFFKQHLQSILWNYILHICNACKVFLKVFFLQSVFSAMYLLQGRKKKGTAVPAVLRKVSVQ